MAENRIRIEGKRMQNFVKKLNCWRKAKSDIPYKIDFVFGVCLIEKNATIDLHQKLDLANYSRRYAKDTPGSFIVLYDEKMRAQALLAQQLESRLDQAPAFFLSLLLPAL